MQCFAGMRYVFLVLLLAVSFPIAAQQQNGTNYSFTLIAQTGERFERLTQPAINHRGEIAFGANIRRTGGNVPGYFISDGTTIRDVFIHDPAHANVPGYGASHPSINDHGYVAFAGVANGVAGIFTSNGNQLTRIYTGEASVPIINNPGQVTFEAIYRNCPTCIGQSFIRAGSGGPLADLGPGTLPFINDRGAVVFYRENQVLMWKNGATTTVVSLHAIQPNSGPAINNSGRVLYIDNGYPPDFTEFAAVKTILNGKITTIANNLTSRFQSVYGRSMNNHAQVAFMAQLFEEGHSGIYTGPDVVEDKVIAAGDTLFGSRVLFFAPMTGGRGINDAGQIAFQAFLADSRVVIVRATPLKGSMRKHRGQHHNEWQKEGGSVLMPPF